MNRAQDHVVLIEQGIGREFLRRGRRVERDVGKKLRPVGKTAGHDLDLQNLQLFSGLPHLAEVSIGHALVSHALFVGLDRSVREYLDAIR